jgi:hypothetical protein
MTDQLVPHRTVNCDHQWNYSGKRVALDGAVWTRFCFGERRNCSADAMTSWISANISCVWEGTIWCFGSICLVKSMQSIFSQRICMPLSHFVLHFILAILLTRSRILCLSVRFGFHLESHCTFPVIELDLMLRLLLVGGGGVTHPRYVWQSKSRTVWEAVLCDKCVAT